MTSHERSTLPGRPPRGVEVEQTAHALRIIRRWFHPLAVLVLLGLAPFLIWLGLTGRISFRLPSWVNATANAAVVLLGLLCVYALIMMLVNRTVIEVADGRLSVLHGPLPGLLPRRVVSASEIEQLFCERHGWSVNFAIKDYDYELKAIMADGSTVSLLKDIPNAKQAHYLEQEIERRLGIADPPGDGR
jgi:hypothetical protein